MPLYEHVFLARQDISQAQVDALTKERNLSEDLQKKLTEALKVITRYAFEELGLHSLRRPLRTHAF